MLWSLCVVCMCLNFERLCPSARWKRNSIFSWMSLYTTGWLFSLISIQMFLSHFQCYSCASSLIIENPPCFSQKHWRSTKILIGTDVLTLSLKQHFYNGCWVGQPLLWLVLFCFCYVNKSHENKTQKQNQPDLDRRECLVWKLKNAPEQLMNR